MILSLQRPSILSARSRRHPPTRVVLSVLLCCHRSFSSSALNIAVITGTTRTKGPPNPILGPRVADFITRSLERRGHQVTVIDPRQADLPLLQTPHFAYAKSQVPAELGDIFKTLQRADAFVCVTPEYNHAPSPALLNILNHFGSSVFSFQPSAIVSYSAGQWGGTRAAMGLRPILSELGCLPVSAMIHIPNAADVLDEDGCVLVLSSDNNNEDEEERWTKYCDRCFSQLEWWGTAAKEHRQKVDPFDESPSFSKTPSQRNAP
jgi:chromate reductase